MEAINANESIDMNNISLNFTTNDKEIAKVCFYTMDEKILFESQYQFNNGITDPIKDFLSKQKNEEKSSFSFYIKNSDSQMILIEHKKTISYYITILQDTLFLMEQGLANNSGITTTMCSNKFLKIYVKKNEKLNIPENVEQHIIKHTQLIGRPASNKLKYYVYKKENKELKIFNISNEQNELIQINFFSRKTSYCNAENNLFIYEGYKEIRNNNSRNYKIYNNCKFFYINLKNNEINLISSAFPQRILHSMIFIPENYIFIIGGKNTKEVLIYTIKKENKNYERYPHLLPCELYEPSLILIDNKYLYAFENSSFCFHIIRTNFTCQSPFEEINLKNNNYLVINQKFFGVVKQKNYVVFLGGQMIGENKSLKNTNYEYNFILETLKQDKRNYFISFDFQEKTFIPLGNEEYIQISETIKNNDYFPILVIFNGNLKKSDKTNTLNGTLKCFESIQTKNINIQVPENLTSLVGSSSLGGEMGIPLYNNYKNK